MRWRDIRTAPLDGSPVLLWAFPVGVGALHLRPFAVQGRWVAIRGSADGYWETHAGSIRPMLWTQLVMPEQKYQRAMRKRDWARLRDGVEFEDLRNEKR